MATSRILHNFFRRKLETLQMRKLRLKTKNPEDFSSGFYKALKIKFGAGDGAQTRDLRLGKATLYQLSYSRVVGETKLQLPAPLVNG